MQEQTTHDVRFTTAPESWKRGIYRTATGVMLSATAPDATEKIGIEVPAHMAVWIANQIALARTLPPCATSQLCAVEVADWEFSNRVPSPAPAPSCDALHCDCDTGEDCHANGAAEAGQPAWWTDREAILRGALDVTDTKLDSPQLQAEIASRKLEKALLDDVLRAIVGGRCGGRCGARFEDLPEPPSTPPAVTGVVLRRHGPPREALPQRGRDGSR